MLMGKDISMPLLQMYTAIVRELPSRHEFFMSSAFFAIHAFVLSIYERICVNGKRMQSRLQRRDGRGAAAKWPLRGGARASRVAATCACKPRSICPPSAAYASTRSKSPFMPGYGRGSPAASPASLRSYVNCCCSATPCEGMTRSMARTVTRPVP